MPFNDDLLSIPLLKLLIPFAAGIVLSHYVALPTIAIVIALSILGLAFFVLSHYIKRITVKGNVLSIIVIAISFGGGSFIYNIGIIDKVSMPEDGTLCYARITEITPKENALFLIADIECDSTHFRAELTVATHDYRLREGSVIALLSHFEPVKNMGNPDEFDYASYMARKGVYYRQFIPKNNYLLIGERHSFLTYSRNLRRNLSNKILESPISPDAQQFLIAVLLGDKSVVDKDCFSNFTEVGLAHVLALSGMHVGIICAIIFFLFMPLNYVIRGKKARYLIVIVALLGYAFITGFSPSVSRAVIMSIFLSIAFIGHRKNSVANSLFASALFILTISPMSLFDVGFQMSFCSVGSILMFVDALNPVSFKRHIPYRIANLAVISFVPMLSTWVIATYYFNTFPSMFLLANLIVIPLFPFVVYLGLFSLLSSSDIIISIFQAVYGFMIHIVDAISSWGLEMVDNVYISPLSVWLYLMMIVMLFLALRYRRLYALLVAVVLGAVALIANIASKNYNNSYLAVFNSYDDSPIVNLEGGKLYLQGLDADGGLERFISYNKRFISVNAVEKIRCIESDTVVSKDCVYLKNHAFVRGVSYALLGRSLNRNYNHAPLSVDYLIISSDFYGSLKLALKYYTPKLIVLGGDIYPDRLDELKSQCAAAGVPFYSVGESGTIELKPLK